MATAGRILAEQIRFQAVMAEQLLKAAGAGTDRDLTGEKLGTPEANLTVCGNIGDIAQMNHYWYLAARAAGAFPGECAEDLRSDCPTDFPGFGQFLSPRETLSAEEITRKLKRVNGEIAKAVEGLTDEQLETPVPTVFGTDPLHRVLTSLLLHGGAHIGQAWGILKGAGHTDEGLGTLFFASRRAA
jgi:hypothetical protein